MRPAKEFNFGNFLFSVYVQDKRVQNWFAGCVLLADVDIWDVSETPYSGEGSILHLRDGRHVRLRGVNLAKFAKLLTWIHVLKSPPQGAVGTSSRS
jgi:hypothetical protein